MKIGEISYTITDRADAVEEEITNTLSTSPSVKKPVRTWTTTRYFGFCDWTAHLDYETGEVKSIFVVSSFFQYALILLTLVLLWELWRGYTVFSLVALAIGFCALGIMLSSPITHLEIDNLKVTQKSTTWFSKISLLVSIILTWVCAYSYSQMPTVLVHIVFLILFGFWLVLPFLDDTKEKITGRTVLGIPFLGFGFVLSAVAHTYAIARITAQNVPRLVFLWSIGGSVVFGVIILIFMFWGCSRVLEDIRNERRIPHINPGILRIGFLLLFLVLNTLTLIGVVALVETLVWGATGSMVLVESSTRTVVLFTEFYSQLDAFFVGYPLLPSRTYSVGFLVFLNAPILIMVAAWSFHLYRELVSKFKLFKLGTTNEALSRLSETEVRVLDTESLLIFPTVVLLGLKQYIVVSRKVAVELDEKELAAIFAHEQYHLKNRDYIVNTLASLLSLFVGGRNSLLVFYNYGRIEREADRYAADTVGGEALISALERLELVQLRERKCTSGLIVGSPGFVKSLSFQSRSPVESGIDLWVRIKSFLAAPYHLFFGSFVFDTAHASIEERKSWIRDDE